MLEGFKQSYPKIRVIIHIDGTECPALKPKRPTDQQATFSTYQNTVKVVAGATPSGLVYLRLVWWIHF